MYDGVIRYQFMFNPLLSRTQFKKTPPKNKFTPEEDKRLLEIVQLHGSKDWVHISQIMGTRNPRQCRERYKNYLNPELRQDPWTPEEDALLEEKFKQYGPRWNKISHFFNARSDNSVRNRWMMLDRHKHKGDYSFSSIKKPSSPEAEQLSSSPTTPSPKIEAVQPLPEISTTKRNLLPTPEIYVNDNEQPFVVQEYKSFDSAEQLNEQISIFEPNSTLAFCEGDDLWSMFTF